MALPTFGPVVRGGERGTTPARLVVGVFFRVRVAFALLLPIRPRSFEGCSALCGVSLAVLIFLTCSNMLCLSNNWPLLDTIQVLGLDYPRDAPKCGVIAEILPFYDNVYPRHPMILSGIIYALPSGQARLFTAPRDTPWQSQP